MCRAFVIWNDRQKFSFEAGSDKWQKAQAVARQIAGFSILKMGSKGSRQ
jgi:hypothetical protein